MSNARNLANLLDATGDVVSAALDNVPPADLVNDTTPQLGGNLDTQTFTVDGRDISTDGTKLDGIETGATADQTGAEIKTAYESNADTNAFTDADHTKLDGIETGATADQTQADINALGITATGLDLGNWTLEESAGVLYFKTLGVSKAKLDGSGNLTCVGNVTAYGAV